MYPGSSQDHRAALEEAAKRLGLNSHRPHQPREVFQDVSVPKQQQTDLVYGTATRGNGGKSHVFEIPEGKLGKGPLEGDSGIQPSKLPHSTVRGAVVGERARGGTTQNGGWTNEVSPHHHYVTEGVRSERNAPSYAAQNTDLGVRSENDALPYAGQNNNLDCENNGTVTGSGNIPVRSSQVRRAFQVIRRPLTYMQKKFQGTRARV